MTKAFERIKVLELGHVYNGPYCGLLLSQLGAEVIKVEPPEGERLRFRSVDSVETHEFLMLNSSKRSVVIDLKTGDGKRVLLDLVDRVDVVVENFGPGAMDRLGLSPASLMARNPRLVYAAGKGYGLSGPYAAQAAMDITVQAMSGTISTTGDPDGPPMKTGPAFIDFSGGVHLFAGVAAALYQREITGRGQLVEVSMHDTVYPALASSLGGLYNEPDRRLPERTGNRHTGLASAPYNVYAATDGWIAIIATTERHFARVAAAIGKPELTDDPRFLDRFLRIRNIDALDAEIESWTSARGRDAIVKELVRREVPCAPVRTLREVAEDPHLIERGMIRTVTHPKRGTVRVPGCPIRLSRSEPGDPTVAPPLGASTDAVLTDLCHYDPDRIDRLRRAGAVS
ncbi:CaiB/BaiF CoA transferase family protein [Streptomyces sp. NPDC055078]